MTKNGVIVFGSQLFDPSFLRNFKNDRIFMAESFELCTYFKFHKIKIAFFLSAMRAYAAELKAAGFKVDYVKLEENVKKQKHMDLVLNWVKENKLTTVTTFEIEDLFMEKQFHELAQELKLTWNQIPSPQFLTSRSQFKDYLKNVKKPFMKTFYERQRKSLDILMDSKGKPLGGQYSFDENNRKKLPAKIKLPVIKTNPRSKTENEVLNLVETTFKDHPGRLKEFWLPTTRDSAKKFLKTFINEKLSNFGPYEDAITNQSDFVFHSGISPLINVGLLEPKEIIREVLKAFEKKQADIASVEGFIRQLIGWREFIRGIYQNYNDQQEELNFFSNQRRLKNCWYNGSTGVPPLDDAIKKADRLAYNHHIERLMIISNLMNLCEIHPLEVHRWFMEMYVDSSDWVMGPNVFGMSLFSDGGIFATKPYTCGSNYYLKMTNDYKKGEWCEIVDGLYWGFIDKHRKFYEKNPRLGMMVKTLDKMQESRRKIIFSAAQDWKNQVSN